MATPTQAKQSQSSVSLPILPRPHWSSKFSLVLLFALVALVADQLTKFLAPGFGFDMQLNGGISFGAAVGLPPAALSVVLVAVVLMLYRDVSPIVTGLVCGSALSNLLDRYFVGGVRDWLPVPLGPLSLNNNLADWLLFGAVLVAVVQFVHGERTHHTSKHA